MVADDATGCECEIDCYGCDSLYHDGRGEERHGQI